MRLRVLQSTQQAEEGFVQYMQALQAMCAAQPKVRTTAPRSYVYYSSPGSVAIRTRRGAPSPHSVASIASSATAQNVHELEKQLQKERQEKEKERQEKEKAQQEAQKAQHETQKAQHETQKVLKELARSKNADKARVVLDKMFELLDVYRHETKVLQCRDRKQLEDQPDLRTLLAGRLVSVLMATARLMYRSGEEPNELINAAITIIQK